MWTSLFELLCSEHTEQVQAMEMGYVLNDVSTLQTQLPHNMGHLQ